MKARIAAALAALLFSAISVAPAFAQQQRGPENQPATVEGGSRASASRQRRERRPAAPTAEQIQAAAQEQATLANTGCQVSESKLLGQTTANTTVYEVACAAGA